MLLYFSLLIFLATLAIYGELVRGLHRTGRLGDEPLGEAAGQPLVSIIVPACNEEQSIGQGLESLCRQTYANLEIIVVDDRSTDNTASVVQRLAQVFTRIRLIGVTQLPAGWLGKTHALYTGAAAAQGEFLLFTDADVCLAPTTLSRAVAAMRLRQLDHLAVIFSNSAPGLLLNSLIADASAGLMLLFKPWKAADPASRSFIGVGAFNMVRASVYRRFGGHETIRLQVIDDIFLGRIIKYHGYRQDALLGLGLVKVPWYVSVRQMTAGLMKNTYALFDYRPSLALLGATAIAATTLLPILLIFVADGWAASLALAAVLVRIVVIGAGMIGSKLPAGAVPFLLVTPVISIYIILRAAWVTHRAGGITWRGTFYPLSELRGQRWLLAGWFRVGG